MRPSWGYCTSRQCSLEAHSVGGDRLWCPARRPARVLALLCSIVFSYFVHYALQLSDGLATDIFSAVAIPNITRFYPVAEVTYTPLELAVRNTGNLFWILWIGNLIAVVILERLFPDPAGPRAK